MDEGIEQKLVVKVGNALGKGVISDGRAMVGLGCRVVVGIGWKSVVILLKLLKVLELLMLLMLLEVEFDGTGAGSTGSTCRGTTMTGRVRKYRHEWGLWTYQMP